VQRQVLLPLRYEDLIIDNGYRIDLLVGERVVVELKALEAILPVHRAQLLSYLRLGRFKLGYLLNFNVARMRDGIVRLVNGL
jgi:GxxExxY protein